MASPKRSHKDAGKILRSKGLLPPGYRLNDLSKNQKDRIRKLERQYSAVVNNPGHYKSQKVSAATARTLRNAGIKVKQNRALIQIHGEESISVRGNKITRDFGNRTQTTIVVKDSDIFKEAEAFFRRKKKNEYLMLRVGDRNAFGVRIHSMADFKKYLHRLSKVKGFEKFQNHLYIVRVKES